MRRGSGLVFDEVITAGTPLFTSSTLNEFLASADHMAIQLVADEVTVSAGMALRIYVSIETSADGVAWATKKSPPEINGFHVVPGKTNVAPHACDTSALPSMRFARLRVMPASDQPGAGTAHVRIHVTLRDGGAHPK
jgi:hypothetical protein